MVLDVDSDAYRTVATGFLDVNDALCNIVAAASVAAGGGGKMAGSDAVRTHWGTQYNDTAAKALECGAKLVEAVGRIGTLLDAGAANHDAAEAASAGGPPVVPGGVTSTGREGSTVVVAPPPPASGGDGDEPWYWWIVQEALAVLWPTGDPSRLRTVAAGWRSAGDDVMARADALTPSIGDLSAVRSPEIDGAVATCTRMQLAARDVAEWPCRARSVHWPRSAGRSRSNWTGTRGEDRPGPLMRDYTEHEMLARYWILDSYLLDYEVAEHHACLRTELVLIALHPAYAPPPPDRALCWRDGTMAFTGADRIDFVRDPTLKEKYTDPDGSRDWGSLYSLQLTDDGFLLDGEFGSLTVVGGTLTITLDDDLPGRVTVVEAGEAGEPGAATLDG